MTAPLEYDTLPEAKSTQKEEINVLTRASQLEGNETSYTQ